MHRFVLHNDEIRDSGEKLLSAGQVGVLSGWGVFSTIRVASGVLFAFERHFARMQRDAALLRVPFPSDADHLRSRLLSLVKANHAENATLRVVVVRNRNGMWEGPSQRDFDLIALTADLTAWGAGVRLALEPNARFAASPYSGAKIISWALNLAHLEKAQAGGFDEVLLLNERGEACECTSANVFASEGSQVWTPPLDSGCLPGVSRELLLTEVRAQGISVAERSLRPEDLERADEVFITSTTRDLLPVVAIQDLKVHQKGYARQRLEEAFRCYLEAYVAAHREPAPVETLS